MDHTDNSWGAAGGVIGGIAIYLANINWQLFFEDLSTSSIKVAVVGVIGGVFGLIGKRLAEKYWPSKKRK